MAKRLRRRRKKNRRVEEEELPAAAGHQPQGDSTGLALLQEQMGNRGVQALLAQQQATGNQTGDDPLAEVEIGTVTIEPPTIDYYDVTGDSLDEVRGQIETDEPWCSYSYDFEPEVEAGRLVKVDVTVAVTLRLPRWIGPGWEDAAEADRAEWQEILAGFGLYEEKFEQTTRLAQQWLLGPVWTEAPEALKSSWLTMLQTLHQAERGHIGLAHRRAVVLQQRLVNQPDVEIDAQFEQFIEDLKPEQEAYLEQWQPPNASERIELSTNLLVQ